MSRRGRAQAEEHLCGDGADAFDELDADAAPPGALSWPASVALGEQERQIEVI